MRVFLHFKDNGAYGGVYLVGSVKEIPNEFVDRVRTSPAVRNGFVWNLPVACAAEKKYSLDRHALLHNQRGCQFYNTMLTQLGISTNGAMQGHAPMDFVLIEIDAGVGDCLEMLLRIRQSRGTAVSDTTQGPALFWAGVRFLSSRLTVNPPPVHLDMGGLVGALIG